MVLGACGDLHRSEERAILLRHLQELPTLDRELMALFYRRWQRIRIEDGMGAETARSVWCREPGDKGFWSRVIGFAVVLGSACNLPHVLVILHWMRTLVIALPLVLAGVAVASLFRWPREWRRVLSALIGALFPQYAGMTACMWQRGTLSKDTWQNSIAIIAIPSFYLGIWVVTLIGCYVYWRSEKGNGGKSRRELLFAKHGVCTNSRGQLIGFGCGLCTEMCCCISLE